MTERARVEAAGLPRWVGRLVLAGLGLCLVLSAYVLWRSAVLQPYSDEFEWVARGYQLQADGDWARYLLTPHNLHRIVWTFALLALDMRAFGGTNLPLIVSGALALAMMAWSLGRQAGRAAPPPLRLPAAALAAMLTLAAGNVLDAATPINVNYVHAAMFAVLALVLAEGGPDSPLGVRGASALLCAAAAAFGNAAGLAVWPVLAHAAIRRRDWGWLAVVLAVGGGFVALYGAGQGQASAASTSAVARDTASAILLALNYLTLPWGRAAPDVVWPAGLAIALLATAALALKGGPRGTVGERLACNLMLFSLGTAAMAGLGRSGLEAPGDVPLRYAVFMAPTHVGLLILALPSVERLWRARRRLAEGLIAAAMVLFLAQNAVIAARLIRISDLNRNLIAEFRAGLRTPQMALTVHPALAHAAAISARLRRDGLFQHELHLKPPPPPR